MNKQREVVYRQRQRVLEGEDLRADVGEIVERVLSEVVDPFTSASRFPEEWDLDELFHILRSFFPISFAPSDLGDIASLSAEELTSRVTDDALALWERKEQDLGYDNMRELERWILLRTLDSKWRDHLYEMDYLREGIGLRALAQKDPLVEYKSEGFEMYQAMMGGVQQDFVRYLFHLEVKREETAETGPRPVRLVYSGGDGIAPAAGLAGGGAASGGAVAARDGSARAFESAQAAARTVVPPRKVEQKVGRNDLCPCGSGKKYKKCCGA